MTNSPILFLSPGISKPPDYSIFRFFLKNSVLIQLLKAGKPSKVMNYHPTFKFQSFSSIKNCLNHSNPAICKLIFYRGAAWVSTRSINCYVYSGYQLIYFQDVRTIVQHDQVDTIYTDFTKSFYQINHNILIKILSNAGFGEVILSGLSSYLKNQK